MQWWFTSDWHLRHLSILQGIRGQVFKTSEEQDENLLSNLFELTRPGDQLFYLGDLAWKYTSQDYTNLFAKMKKHKLGFHWILGNHDKPNILSSSLVWKGQIKDVIINKQPITLSHYPMVVWNKSHYNAWNLYGHIHVGDHTHSISKDYPMLFEGKKMNVNCEMYDYKPLSFDQVKAFMDSRPNNFDFIQK